MKNGKALIIFMSIVLLSAISSADLSVIEVNEGDLVNLKVTAKDADQDKLFYVYDPPLNNTGQWQTTYGDFGEWYLNITVSDGKFNTIQPMLIKVKKVNWPPVLEPLEDITVDETETVKIKPKASDEEGDKLAFTFSDPLGDDGVWKTTYDDAGEYDITISVTDGEHEVIEEFLLIINNVNRDPIITEQSPVENEVNINENDKEIFEINAKDPDNDDLTYLWELDGKEVSTEETFIYRPDFESAGDHNLKATVSDGEVLVNTEWDISVDETNRPPTVEPIDDILVNEGETVNVSFIAADPDGDDVYYQISNLIGDDKIWQTGYEDAGSYDIELNISDGEEIVTETFTIVVQDVDRAPDFTEIEDITITEEESVEITLQATDPDGDKVAFTAEGIPEGAAFEEDKFTFTPNYETVAKPRNWFNTILKFLRIDNLVYPKQKRFQVKFTAKGKEKAAEQEVEITVKHVNRAPILLEMGDVSVNENEKLVIVPEAIEYDNDRVKFTISQPIGNNGKWKPSFEDAGVYDITISAFDGEFTDSQNITLTVNNVNRAPEFEVMKDLEINEGEKVSIQPIVTDPDGDPIELRIDAMPKGAEWNENMLSWIPDNSEVQWSEGTKSYQLKFIAADDQNANATQEMVATINNVNIAPEFVNTSPQSKIKVLKGTSVIFIGKAEDFDNNTLQYDWKFGFFDKLKDATPAIKRTFRNTGWKTIELTVTDGYEKITHTWKVHVVEPKKKTTQKTASTTVKTNTVKTGSVTANKTAVKTPAKHTLTVV